MQWPVFLKLQNELDLGAFQYYRLEDNDVLEFEYNAGSNSIYLAQFVVGTDIPGPALSFSAQEGGRQMSLSWRNRMLCSSGGDLEICNNTLNCYLMFLIYTQIKILFLASFQVLRNLLSQSF